MMAEDKKPKIDLKARLGKKTVSTPGGSIPPPVGIPKPAGIPAPPFGGGSMRAAPSHAAANPYTALPAEAAPIRAQSKAITVEMSEEVLQAQRRGRSRIIVLAAVTAVIGGFMGFASGSANERSKQDKTALASAERLSKDVEASSAEIEKLADVLKAAKEKLGENQYPEKEIADLGGINIPFGGDKVSQEGRGIGRFKGDIVIQLLTFATGAEEANDQKEKIQRLLTGSKTQINEFLTQQTTPKVRWSVFVVNGPHGPWAAMQLLPKPFLAKSDKKEKDADGKEKAYSWPEEFEIKDGDRTSTLKRYTGGDATGGPKIIPVDPTSQGSVCPSDVAVKLRREIGDLEDTLRGKPSDIPGEEKQGLLEQAKILKDKLDHIGFPG
jgi:hypothetical protein